MLPPRSAKLLMWCCGAQNDIFNFWTLDEQYSLEKELAQDILIDSFAASLGEPTQGKGEWGISDVSAHQGSYTLTRGQGLEAREEALLEGELRKGPAEAGDPSQSAAPQTLLAALPGCYHSTPMIDCEIKLQCAPCEHSSMSMLIPAQAPACLRAPAAPPRTNRDHMCQGSPSWRRGCSSHMLQCKPRPAGPRSTCSRTASARAGHWPQALASA